MCQEGTNWMLEFSKLLCNYRPAPGGPTSTAMASMSRTRPIALENFSVPTIAIRTSNCSAPTMP